MLPGGRPMPMRMRGKSLLPCRCAASPKRAGATAGAACNAKATLPPTAKGSVPVGSPTACTREPAREGAGQSVHSSPQALVAARPCPASFQCLLAPWPPLPCIPPPHNCRPPPLYLFFPHGPVEPIHPLSRCNMGQPCGVIVTQHQPTPPHLQCSSCRCARRARPLRAAAPPRWVGQGRRKQPGYARQAPAHVFKCGGSGRRRKETASVKGGSWEGTGGGWAAGQRPNATHSGGSP